METIIYDPRIEHLIDKISYGTLGLLQCLVKRANDPASSTSRDIILVNGGTIIRNCYDNDSSDKVLIEKVNQDFKMLYSTIDSYTSHQSIILTYFHPDINKLIPEALRRKETPLRLGISNLIDKMSRDEQLIPNKLVCFSKGDHMSLYGLRVSQNFAYRLVGSMLHNLMLKLQQNPLNKITRISMVTHCPIDYFLMENFPVKIILSHTGKILKKRDISFKVFKDENIPFNRTTYKLFGDKDFIKGSLKNRPKFIKMLKQNNINLKLKTEREIALLAHQYFDITQAELNWKL